MVQSIIPPGRVSPIFSGTSPENDELYAAIKPVRYRYVMAYLHDTIENGVLRKAGEVMAILPMTSVTYSVGLYIGTDMGGSVYLPDFYLDQMPHPPLNDFDRIPHPDQQGMPLGAIFECGNRAVYVMRNDKVVWGGILWSRNYSSGDPTLTISALSWEGYIYYRLLRQSVVFNTPVNVYTIWYAVLKQAMEDFTWKGTDNKGKNSGIYPDGVRQISTKKSENVPWTGISGAHANEAATNFDQAWPNNSPNIELPSPTLLWKRGPTGAKVEVKAAVKETFRGWDMKKVGEALEEWADTATLISPTGSSTALSRFEYKVLCWFDTQQQIFRQRYTFGEMTYGTDPNVPTGIGSEFIGKNTKAMVDDTLNNKLIFDYPGHISEWSLQESMEEAATRVITTDQLDMATKHAGYVSQKDLLDVPSTGTPNPRGSQGWLLYDRTASYDITKNTTSVLLDRAGKILNINHVPEAAQISDLGTAPPPGRRTSERSTDLSVTLYQEPTTPFPEFGVGDWATFAISDPFYGGTMYLQRRILAYTVSVVPDHESDYSHETFQLDVTDETRVDLGT